MGVRMTIKNTIFNVESIPVASYVDYINYWKNPAIKLGLKLIPILHEFYIIENIKEAEQLLAEIVSLYDWLVNHNDEHFQKHGEERVRRVLEAVQDAINNWEQVEYIDFG